MVEIDEISDHESLVAWFETLPRQSEADAEAAYKAAVWIAHRAAMRVLPIAWLEAVIEDQLKAIPELRCNFMAGVCWVGSNYKIRNLAHEATCNQCSPLKDPKIFERERCGGSIAAAYASADTAKTLEAPEHSMSYTVKVASRAASGPAFWDAIRSDCLKVERGVSTQAQKLWASGYPDLERAWEECKHACARDAADWSFWIEWYEDALTGRVPNWDLLMEIAKQEGAFWLGSAADVNGRIADIVKAHADSQQISAAPLIQQAVRRNLTAIPPQLDALVATLDAEIERLRGRNPADDIEKEEIDRLRGVFETMKGAIRGLHELLPATGSPPLKDAEEMAGLLGLYMNEFQKWPRENAADLVDSSCRVVLVGITAGAITAFGLPAMVGAAIGGVAFGGKKLAGMAKSIKDNLGPEG